MNLVGYSDSEGSDEEVVAPPPRKVVPKGFAKLVSSSSHKVRVNLASVDPQIDQDRIEEETRPAKKPRTGGGGLNINAFLPAPKKAVQASKGLGRGVNLRTGPEPAFTREPAPPSYSLDLGSQNAEMGESPKLEPPKSAPSQVAPYAAKPLGKSKRLVPLSVAKTVKKKALTSTVTPKNLDISTGFESASSTIAPTKPKVSLFSMSEEESSVGMVEKSFVAEYNPVMLEDDEMVEAVYDLEEIPTQQHAFGAPQPARPAGNIDTLTSDLNLSNSDMRQLFGRNAGKRGREMPDLSNINVVNFNTDAEYAANNEIIAKGETVSHNPVRGIAPGKHSLKQLVTAATTQKEALEEHFAKSKRNAQEAGARYGW